MSNARNLASFGNIVGELTGELKMWPTDVPPAGYLICDGSAVSRATYSALYAVIGTTFGSGNGSSTFNLPNYVDRMPVGKGSGVASTIGATGGSKDAVVPAHSHTISDPGHNHTYSFRSALMVQSGSATPCWAGTTTQNTSASTTGITINSTGVSASGANMPPYMGINFIIKY